MSYAGPHRLDMCEGPLLVKIVQFALPLYATLLLKLLFNAADLIVVGRYADHRALAAVGATASLVNMLVNIFFGLAVGTNVLAATAFGGKDEELLLQTTHTSMATALAGGILSVFVGQVAARPLLELMSTPGDILGQATRYMRIYFMGMPVMLVYDFGSAILRGVGDTRRPLAYLAISGLINVPLNVFFVTCCGMDVDGVACATVIAQVVSAVLVWRALSRSGDSWCLQWRQLRIHWPVMRRMLVIGIPAAAQASFFSLSNVLIQSTVNTFGTLVVAGNSVLISLGGICYACPNAVHQTTLSMVGQNFGARQADRIRRGIWLCLALGAVMSELIGLVVCFFGPDLIRIYNSNPEVLRWGMLRARILLTWYVFAGTMDVVSGALRGLGRSLTSAITVMCCVCVLRIVWLYTVFPASPTMSTLLWSYPISWALGTLFNGLFLWLACRRLFGRWRREPAARLGCGGLTGRPSHQQVGKII